MKTLFSRPIIGAFTEDPSVTAYALSYMRSVPFSYAFLATMMVVASAFQALGRSWPGFWMFVLRFLVLSLPLAYIFTIVLGWPIPSLWAAMIAGNVLAAVLGYAWITRTMKTFDFRAVEETVHSA